LYDVWYGNWDFTLYLQPSMLMYLQPLWKNLKSPPPKKKSYQIRVFFELWTNNILIYDIKNNNPSPFLLFFLQKKSQEGLDVLNGIFFCFQVRRPYFLIFNEMFFLLSKSQGGGEGAFQLVSWGDVFFQMQYINVEGCKYRVKSQLPYQASYKWYN